MEKTNAQKFGTFVAEAMENMEKDFPDSEIGNIAIIAEFQTENEDGSSSTTTRFICTDPRNYVQLGLLHSALISAEAR